MKKTAVIIGSVFLFILLVGFNFLLWENSTKSEDIRELETRTASMDRSVSMLLENLTELDDRFRALQVENNHLKQTIRRLEQEKSDLIASNLSYSRLISERSTFINELMEISDIAVFEKILSDWIRKINEKDFFVAHSLQGQRNIFETGTVYTLNEMIRQFDGVERMELVSLTKQMDVPLPSDQFVSHIQYDGVIHVALSKANDQVVSHPLFIEGNNVMTVKFEYNYTSSSFLISGIQIRN